MPSPFLFRTTPKPLALKTKNIQFKYKNQEVLNNLNLEIKPSRITALIGSSGSGKSTLLKLIASVATKSHKGKIKLFGSHQIFSKKKIGYVPQELAMIPDLSLEDNIKVSGALQGLSEEQSLKRSSELQYQLQLEEPLSKFPTELSGGQRVRLNIILSLLHNPDLLILDEPFVGLDFQNRRLLWHFLETKKKQGKSILLTSHLLAETQQHADEIAIIDSGHIAFKGSVAEFQEKLKITFIMELSFNPLSQEKQEKLKAFCDLRDIALLDLYTNHALMGLANKHKANALLAQLNKLTDKVEITSTREPNLDELFLTGGQS